MLERVNPDPGAKRKPWWLGETDEKEKSGKEVGQHEFYDEVTGSFYVRTAHHISQVHCS